MTTEKKALRVAAASNGSGSGGSSSAPAVPALVCHGHSRPIVEISYSPITPDGYFLISASKDGRPMLRNGETGDWIGTFEGHKGAVWSATLDMPALRAATASADFSAKVWNALTGDEMHSFEHKHIARTVDFSQDTKKLLTGGAEKLLRIFHLERPDAAPTIIGGHPGTVRCAKWHDNDNLVLVTCSDIPGVKIWDVRSEQAVASMTTSAPCSSMEVGADGKTITLADGSSVAFWDRAGGKVVLQFPLPHKAISASLCPTRRVFAAGGDDMWVRVFDLDTAQELECHKGHHGPVHCVRFAPDGLSCASGSEDGTIRIWRSAPAVAATADAAVVTADGTAKAGDVAVANGSTDGAGAGTEPVRVGADEVTRKIEGFHIAGQS